jgi:hypothetical protein
MLLRCHQMPASLGLEVESWTSPRKPGERLQAVTCRATMHANLTNRQNTVTRFNASDSPPLCRLGLDPAINVGARRIVAAGSGKRVSCRAPPGAQAREERMYGGNQQIAGKVTCVPRELRASPSGRGARVQVDQGGCNAAVVGVVIPLAARFEDLRDGLLRAVRRARRVRQGMHLSRDPTREK